MDIRHLPTAPARLRPPRAITAALVLAGALLAACGSTDTASTSGSPTAAPPSSSPTAAASTAPAAAATPAPAATAIRTGTTSAGTVVTDSSGMTLYRFTPEQGTHIVCTGACAGNWPPDTIPSASALSKSSDLPGTIGSVMRPDGSLQVTYNGWPLYHFSGDSAPGQANGQGFAGKWFAVTPDVAA